MSGSAQAAEPGCRATCQEVLRPRNRGVGLRAGDDGPNDAVASSSAPDAPPDAPLVASRKHVCGYCEKRFLSPGKLAEHERVHTGPGLIEHCLMSMLLFEDGHPGRGSPCRLHFSTSTSCDPYSKPRPDTIRSSSRCDHRGEGQKCQPSFTLATLVTTGSPPQQFDWEARGD